MKLTIPVLAGHQNGKTILTGTISAADIISALTSEALSVNPKAQRSLAGAGANKETTRQLLDDERVHKTPRMKSFVAFQKRVMEELEKGHSDQGFFGALSLAVPEEFKAARVLLVEHDEGVADSPALAVFQSSLRSDQKLGVFIAEPGLGEPAIHIGDGQGRSVGFYAFDKTLTEQVAKIRKHVKKLEAARQDASEEKRLLQEAEKVRDRARRFVSKNDIPFVLYVQTIKNDGAVVGISEEAEKRMYIEGNALNTQAGKEQVIKYETWSPIVVALQQIRESDEFTWMSPDYIEEDAKSIPVKSTKVFTLSTLVQAHSRAMMGSENAALKVPENAFEVVEERDEFVRAFWQRVTKLFGAVWVPPNLDATERLAYLEKRRDEQSVLFSAVFLQALGQLGYTLGKAAQWNAESDVLNQLDKLKRDLSFYAARQNGAYNKQWSAVMMKEKTDKQGQGTGEFNFYNTRDTVQGTHALLSSLVGVSVTGAADDDNDDGDATEEAEQELTGAGRRTP